MKELIYLFSLIFILACGESAPQESPVDPMNAALPHGESMEKTELSPEDKNKLLEAKGRTVVPISFEALRSKMEIEEPRLQIFNFWSLSCKECLQLNQLLTKFSSEMGSDKINLVLINTNASDSKDKINIYLREQNIISEAYHLEGINNNDQWKKALVPKWEGDLPATVFLNSKEEINILYQNPLTYEELEAVIAPLIL